MATPVDLRIDDTRAHCRRCAPQCRVLQTFTAGDKDVHVKQSDGRLLEITSAQSSACRPMDEQSLEELDDMVQFNDLSEAPLLHNLRKRFENDRIYTFVGTILCAVNPFKLLPIYTPEVRKTRLDGRPQRKLCCARPVSSGGKEPERKGDGSSVWLEERLGVDALCSMDCFLCSLSCVALALVSSNDVFCDAAFLVAFTASSSTPHRC